MSDGIKERPDKLDQKNSMGEHWIDEFNQFINYTFLHASIQIQSTYE